MIFGQPFHRRSFFLYGESLRIFRATKLFDGADAASRSARPTNERAKICERRVVNARGALWNKRGRMLPKFFPAAPSIDRAAKIKNAHQHARSVGFDNRNCLIKGEAGDGVRGVFPDSRESLHLIDRSRKASAKSIYDGPCSGVKISRTSVIAESLPGAQNIVFGSAI